MPAAPEVRAGGYHVGSVDTVISVEDVARQAEQLRVAIDDAQLRKLAQGRPFVSIEGLRAGYGNMEILHDFTLHVAKGQSLCLIGPNGAGKSTVLPRRKVLCMIAGISLAARAALK